MNIDINITKEDELALKSNNEILVISSLVKIKNKGDLSHLALVIDAMASTPTDAVKKIASEIFICAKSDELRSILLSSITENRYLQVRKELVSACWECGMDFSSSLPVFAKLMAGNDNVIGLEAYTVIIQNAAFASEQIKKECATILQEVKTGSILKGLSIDCIEACS
jgi:hypothetical protein